MIIAVDGPSGAGKGTLSKRLSSHYNLVYLDTGLIYRAVAYQMMQHGHVLEDESAANHMAQHLDWQNLPEISVLRTDDVAQGASKIAVYPGVRSALLDFQRHFAHFPPHPYVGAVLDGRDIASNVCPDADYKLFVTASLEIRAKRRYKELQDRKIKSIYSDVLKDMTFRDQRDQTRSHAPLQLTENSILIDTTDYTAEEAFSFAVSCIEYATLQQKGSANGMPVAGELF